MKYPKPMFYVVVLLAFAGLLYTIYQYKLMIEGFEIKPASTKTIAEHFQGIPDNQKGFICKTLQDEIDKMDSKTDTSAINRIRDNMNLLGCAQ